MDQISLSGCLYFMRYWAMCAFQLFVKPFCDAMNFKVNLIFLIKPIFLHGQKVVTKN